MRDLSVLSVAKSLKGSGLKNWGGNNSSIMGLGSSIMGSIHGSGVKHKWSSNLDCLQNLW